MDLVPLLLTGRARRALARFRRLELTADRTVTWDRELPGHDRFYSADPFGNRLEFLQPQSA